MADKRLPLRRHAETIAYLAAGSGHGGGGG